MPNGTAPPPLWAATGLPPEWGACPQYGQAPCAAGFGAHLWGTQIAPVPYVPPTPEKQVYYGIVKAFDEEKGWGHISCDVTRQVYGKDMFVLRSSLHGTKISAGDEVQFTLRQGLRGVEATEVRPLSRATTTASPDEAFSVEGAMQAGQPEATGREFVGTLKMFDNTKGWGFLECDESRQLYGKDIFVHKREFPKGCTPDNGDRLRFVVERGRDARPEARRVSLDDPTAAIAGMAPIAALMDVAAVGADVAGATVVAGAAQLGPELLQYGAARTPDIGPAERVAPY
uniref:CSD domain-containing protein n=1 Tax=Alexandrium catenella TaxID=2925 RepID=A0A7S1RM95_ALECA